MIHESTADGQCMRLRPRTYPYREVLPYETETVEESLVHLVEIVRNLVICIQGNDLKGTIGTSATTARGLVIWTRELRSWIDLKNDMPLDIRIKLVRLYYNLSLSGSDGLPMDKFINMFCILCKDDNFQDNVTPEQLNLDWKLLITVLKKLAMPQQSSYDGNISGAFTSLSRLAQMARHFLTPTAILEIMQQVLEKASISHNVLSLLVLLLPPPPQAQDYDVPKPEFVAPQEVLPAIFHLWTLVPRSSLYDYQCLDLVATIVSDSISSSFVPFNLPGGLLTEDQLNIVFSAILRLLEIPVSSAGSPYLHSSETVSLNKDRDKKPRCARPIAFLIVYSIAGKTAGSSVLSRLETLINTCTTFCHPSNYGTWTRNVMYSVCTTVEYFLLRWNVQNAGESMLPLDRRLTGKVKDRFVDCLLPVTLLGIHAKASQVVSWSLEALQGLAHLAPYKVIPKVLVDAYTSLQNVESTHRAVSAFRALTACSTIIIRDPAFAMHVATLLQLSLPGIDANDLTKTRHALSFIQNIALQIPLSQSIYVPKTNGADMDNHGLSSTGSQRQPRKRSKVSFNELVEKSGGGGKKERQRSLSPTSVAPDGNIGSPMEVEEEILVESNAVPEPNYNSFNYAEAANYGERSSISGPSVVEGLADATYAVSQAISELGETSTIPAQFANNPDVTWPVVCGTSSLFEEFVHSFFSRVFTLIGNLPETAAGDSAESQVMNALPPSITAVLGALSPSQFSKTVDYVIRLMDAADLANASAEPAAHVCGALVRIDAHLAFRKLFPFLDSHIRFEIDENGAGTTRNSGRTTLPRDRALIWYLSALNMVVAHAGREILTFKKEVDSLTSHMRLKCGGAILYHAANTLHHVLMTLTTTFVQETRDSEEEYGRAPWGTKIDCQKLGVRWHVPTEAEYKLAVDLYETHVRISVDAIREIVSQPENARGVFVTQASDILMSNATYLRTLTGGIAVMAQIGREHQESSRDTTSHRELMSLSNPASPYVSPSPFPSLPSFPYSRATAWHKYFQHQPVAISSQLRHRVVQLRSEVGLTLHTLLQYLSKRPDNATQKATLFAIKVWFSDVGYERSAKALDSMAALYNYECKIFRLPGSRKDYPRRVLLKRAQLYHLQRQSFGFVPHEDLESGMTNLEKRLLKDLQLSAISVYSDVRRNGAAALDAALKMFPSKKRSVYRWTLDEIQSAVISQDWHKAEACMHLLCSSFIQLEMIRDVHSLMQLTDCIKNCVKADDARLNSAANSAYNLLATGLRLPLDDPGENPGRAEANIVACCQELGNRTDGLMNSLGDIVKQYPGSGGPHDYRDLAAAYASLRDGKRAEAEKVLQELVESLASEKFRHDENYWKVQAMHAGIFAAVCSSPQVPADSRSLQALCQGAAFSPHQGIQMLCKHGLFRVTSKMFNLAASGYDYGRFLLDCDEENLLSVSEDAMWIDSSGSGFTEKFINEMRNTDHSNYYLDRASTSFGIGWLIWPRRFAAIKANDDKNDKRQGARLSPEDESAVRKFGQTMTVDWVRKLIERNLEEKQTTESEEYFDVTNAIFYKIVLRLIGYGYAAVTLNQFLEEVKKLVFDQLSLPASHRCGAEICSAVVDSLKYTDVVGAEAKLAWLSDVYGVVIDALSLDNVEYWASFVWWGCNYIDIRRGWKLHRKLMYDVTALVDAVGDNVTMATRVGASRLCARLELIRKCVQAIDWHLQDETISESLFRILDTCRNLAAVREECAATIALLYTSQYHESYQNVHSFLKDNSNASTTSQVGRVGYIMAENLAGRIISLANSITNETLDVSDQIARSKCLCLLLQSLCNKSYGSSLVALLPDVFPAILSFVSGVSAKDADMDLARSGLSLLKSLGNLPYPVQYVSEIVSMLRELVFRTESQISWHEKLALLAFLQAFFFRQLFKLSRDQQDELRKCVTQLLNDPQLEVRDMSSETLSGLIRCSPVDEQQRVIDEMTRQWAKILAVRQTKQNVLGLGALVRAFPYQSPPPKWLPQVVAHLCRAADTSGMVGRSVKETLAEFKKTRQDTWQIDCQFFTSEQLQDLEGVLWKNYFV